VGRDGKVVEFNSYPEIAGLMTQLGFMPQMVTGSTSALVAPGSV
jgi:hypothetical protein